MATKKNKTNTKSAGKAKSVPVKAKAKARAKTKAKLKPVAKKKSAASAKSTAAGKKGAAKTSAKAKASEKSFAAKPIIVRRTEPTLKARVSPKKPLPREFLVGLADAIKEAVAPVARSLKGREITGTAVSGDTTFELDVVAEKALRNFLGAQRAPVAYYSEDEGYSTFSSAQPTHLLLVDPIDGTRAAKNAFEGCVVSIASTRVIERPVMGDVETACVVELLGDRVFYAERGKGARMYEDGHLRRPRISKNSNLETMSWAMTVPARPAELIFPTVARLVDLSSLKGGFFSSNSTAYSITRLLSGQLDACVDFAGRYLKDIPNEVRDYFINAGRGAVLGAAPYDMAAALLIAREAGCIVTDAYGKTFEDILLLDSSVANHQSIVAAGNAEMHEKLLSFLDTRIKQFEQLLQRRNG